MPKVFAETAYPPPGPRSGPPPAPPPPLPGPSRTSWRAPASSAPTGQTIRSTNQKIHSYTNAHQYHLQEKIPPNKPYIGLRPAYRPGYAICVMLAGGVNLISGILMTALAYSHRVDEDNLTARVLRVLGPVAIVIGIIFLLCGLVLLLHFRHRKEKEKWAREHGQGTIDRPSRRYPGPPRPREYQDRHGSQLPVQTPVDNYSYYTTSIPRNATRIAETDLRDSRRLQRPPGGDWKYVSDLRDATLSPRYPREERKPLDGVAANKHKLYPYDQSFNGPYTSPPVREQGPGRLETRKPPRPRQRDRRDERDGRY